MNVDLVSTYGSVVQESVQYSLESADTICFHSLLWQRDPECHYFLYLEKYFLSSVLNLFPISFIKYLLFFTLWDLCTTILLSSDADQAASYKFCILWIIISLLSEARIHFFLELEKKLTSLITQKYIKNGHIIKIWSWPVPNCHSKIK